MSQDPVPNVQTTTDAPLLAGRYQIFDKLGEGGMGAVFRARDTQLGRQVAVKQLPPGSIHDATAVARFSREARALAHLSHPGIIQAFDSGQDGDTHFLVMEYVAGNSLARELMDRGRLAPARAADYAYQAALALHHAHQNGLVHRDIKPSNLLVNAQGQVKLLDLGLARFLQDQVGDSTLTREGVGMGTPDYAAPEQLRDAHKADPRSDIYSLGCTLYHLLTGRVPFPGSSLSEKMNAHATQEPAPLDELCPEMPAGLALVVQRMMAKRPADRFKSMAEVAEALLPYVSASSPSLRVLRSTWTSMHFPTMTALPRRRVLAPWMIAGAAVLALLALGFIGHRAGWFRASPQQGPPALAARAEDAGKEAPLPVSSASNNKPSQEPRQQLGPGKAQTPRPPDDPNILTVSQKPEGGGKYQTIREALKAVRPGQTIRIVDNAVYQERLSINRASKHTGISLEAPGGAILETTTPRSVIVEIRGVKGVTLRGLRLRARNTDHCSLVAGRFDWSGLQLEGLDFSNEGAGVDGGNNNGVELHGISSHEAPALVQSCRFRGLTVAVLVAGDEGTPPTAVRDGTFTDCAIGVYLTGKIEATQVVGNRFLGARLGALQIQSLSPDSNGILLANNTCYEGISAFRLWDSAIHGKNVQIRNNLVLGCQGTDMYYFDAVDPLKPRGPGDGKALARAYHFDHNWREGKAPARDARGWVPPDPEKGDGLKEKISGVNRDPEAPDFLRPDKDAPLATAGAGNEDPSLPRYVGALPPKDVLAWDWDRTWKMPKDAPLLTVSQEASGGGKYRTINDALRDAKPWATIRVLDDATYEETIKLTDGKKHEGITLEAVQGAILNQKSTNQYLITIEDVAHVCIRGFKCRSSGTAFGTDGAFVKVSGAVPGVVLRGLTLTSKAAMYGVVLQNAVATRADPLRVEHCIIGSEIPRSNDGISVVGKIDRDPSGRIILRSNRIFNANRGINLNGTFRDVHVVGNLLANCPASGLQLEDLAPASRGLLLANNTALGGNGAFRVWDNLPYEQPAARQVEVANNLFFAASMCDVGYVLDPGMGKDQCAGDAEKLLKQWRFHHNRRDFSGENARVSIRGRSDKELKRGDLLSRSPDEPDRIRPGKDSPLASQGAGTEDGALPVYIGALPPEGAPVWRWDRTWRARVPLVEATK